MDKAKRILEEALSYKNCDGLIEENSRLEDAVLYAINEALRQPPVSGSASDFERELYKLINEYVSAGLKKPDLVHKLEYVTQSCRVS